MMLIVASAAIVLQFIVFKILYPYAGFIDGDSYVYLQSAFLNLDINTYPVGYSKFLRLFSVFTKSDTALVAFQYLFIQASALFFIFSLFYIFNPKRSAKWLVFFFVVFNPLFLYLSNYVSSDSIFLGQSLIWFTLLLWIIRSPTLKLAIIHAVILLLAFSVRYNALYYPLIAALAFTLSSQRLRVKLLDIGMSIVLILCFITYTSNKYKSYLGFTQFTPFTGWQMANNALYAYRYVDSSHRKTPPVQFREIDKMVTTYFDTTRDIRKHPDEMWMASTVYMWSPFSPLQRYMNSKFKHDSIAPREKKWASMSPFFKSYGEYIIKQYPLQFAEFYLWPNLQKYYAPPIEFLSSYNSGEDSVHAIAQVWFGFSTNRVRTAFKSLKVSALNFLPIFSGVMNVIFIVGFLSFYILNGFRQPDKSQSKIMLLGFTLWIVNFGFSVFASPVTLRYQSFPILVFTAFSILLLDYIVKLAFSTKQTAQA